MHPHGLRTDITCRIHVTINPHTTGRALKDTHAKVELGFRSCSAGATRLRGRKEAVNNLYLRAVPAGFILQLTAQCTKSGVQNGPVQPGLLAHTLTRCLNGTGS